MASHQTALKARFGIILAGAAALTLAINDVSVPFSYARGFTAPTVVLARFAFLLASLVILLPVLGLSYRLPKAHMLHALGSPRPLRRCGAARLTLARILGSTLVIGAVVVSEIARNRIDVAVEPVG